MFRTLVGLAIVGTLLIGAGVQPTDLTAAVNERKMAPNFSLDDSQGKTIQLSDFRGKVVLLDFWATWCHGCKTEIPWYMEFEHKYKENGLAVIGVSMDEDGWKSVKPFVAEHKINYPIVVGNQDLGKLYSVETLPVTLLIDRDGKIAEAHMGMVEKAAFENEIKALLHEGK
jgi:peroxiredoxin